MPELSADTQAIIQRLKDEGQLVRNSGTNSIRSVKIQLDKFDKVFNVISNNISDQTSILKAQERTLAEDAERKRTQEQYDEINKEKIKEEKNDDVNEKIDKMGDKIESSISNALSFRSALGGLKDLALLGGGLFVGYNLLKGFVDERTGGGFTKFEENFTSTIRDMDWEGLKNNIFDIGNTVSELSEALASLLGMIKGFIDNPWSLFSIGLGFGAGRFLGGRVLSSIFGGGAAGAGGAGGNWLTKALGAGGRFLARNAGPLAFLTAALDPTTMGDGTVSGQAQRNLEERGILPPNEAIANVSQEMYDRLSSAYQEQLDAEIVRMGEEMGAATEAWVAEMDANRTPEEEARLAELRAQNMERDRAAREQRLRDAAREYAAQNPGLFDPSDYVEQFERKRTTDEANRIMSEEEARRREEEIAALTPRVNELDERLRSMESDAGVPALSSDLEEYSRILDEFISLNTRLGVLTNRSDGISLNIPGYRTGTDGFMDFGAGQFAVLHGREAVVPFNTAAGRFLDQYFTENWEPKVVNTQRLQTAATGGASGGTVIISAPTTVAPTVNNVSGGKSINQLSVSGGGGMGSIQTNPYGIPGAAN